MSKFYKCSCYSEAVEIQKNAEGDVEMCFWQIGLSPRKPASLREKFRWIWYILRHDDFWADECILKKETAKELGEELIRISQET